MAVRFLNCASMHPWWPRWQVGGMCLLVDTEQGPVLVDTGLGLHDHETPSPMVKFFRADFGIPFAPQECAVRQVENLGIHPREVGNIILTHLHFDHAGGLPDFPWANIHLHNKEYQAMLHPKKWIEIFAYDPADFAHHPRWVTYEEITDNWFGFDAIRLPFTPGIFLIPLFGHTSGHCGVAIEDGDGWVFQAGDSIPLDANFHVTPAWVNRIVLGKHIERLRAFTETHPNIRLLAGHATKGFFERE